VGSWGVIVRDVDWPGSCFFFSLLDELIAQFFCLFALQPPFDGNDEDQLFEAILTQEVRYPRILSSDATSIIKGVSAIECIVLNHCVQVLV
jgi:hypothetical protein